MTSISSYYQRDRLPVVLPKLRSSPVTERLLADLFHTKGFNVNIPAIAARASTPMRALLALNPMLIGSRLRR